MAKKGTSLVLAIDSTAEMILGLTEGGNGFYAVSGGESRDWIFSYPVAYRLGRPHLTLYKDSEKNPPIGADVKGQDVAHVADLQNEGSSIEKQWQPQIEKAGGRFVRAFFYVDRLEDGVDVMARLGIPSDAVVPMDQHAWQALLEAKYVSPEVYRASCVRLEDKKAWAHDALRTHVDELERLLKDPKSRAKAEKVLLVGYPELKDELLDRLKQLGYTHKFTEEKK